MARPSELCPKCERYSGGGLCGKCGDLKDALLPPSPHQVPAEHIANARQLTEEGKCFWLYRFTKDWHSKEWGLLRLDLPESLERALAAENVEVMKVVPIDSGKERS